MAGRVGKTTLGRRDGPHWQALASKGVGFVTEGHPFGVTQGRLSDSRQSSRQSGASGRPGE